MKKEDHQIQAAHHVVMCKIHNTCHDALEDGEQKEFHKAAAAEHLRMADHHAECCKAMMADGPSKILSPLERERFGKVADDGVRVAGTVPDNPNVRLVTRAGSPSVEEIEKANGTAAIPEKHRQVFERRTAGE
jgi:hypothetical protein